MALHPQSLHAGHQRSMGSSCHGFKNALTSAIYLSIYLAFAQKEGDKMRMIQISTDVFQAIWAARQAGEETEDEILRRLLVVRSGAQPTPQRTSPGFVDKMSGVEFREGFLIFRNYLGTEYQARAQGGKWVLEGTGESANSLNRLSALVGPKQENAWENWKYTDGGEVRKISALRDPTKIHKRAARS
jgi:hypothetical protein